MPACAPLDKNLDTLVDEILRTFALQAPSSTHWHRRVSDLRWVLQADYVGTVDAMVHTGSLPLHDLPRRAGLLFPHFNSAPLHFDETIARVSDTSQGPGVRVCMAPYGQPGHPLRGFYHRGEDARSLIWLNLGHVPNAVAATLAHEVGHWLWDDIHAKDVATVRPFYNAAFAEHLNDPPELFADAFTTMAAYPVDLARRFFSGRNWPVPVSGLRAVRQATVGDVYTYLQNEYGPDLAGVSVPRRFYYVTSMIHFAKVRAAVLHTTGL